jgi:hypothetical protein
MNVSQIHDGDAMEPVEMKIELDEESPRRSGFGPRSAS